MEKYYDLDPSTFYDSNSSGCGDYNGILIKKQYFNKLGVENIIFPNPLFFYKSNFIEEIAFNESKHGNYNDFCTMVKSLSEDGIKSLVRINYEDFEEMKLWHNNLNTSSDINQEIIKAKSFNEIDKTESYYISSKEMSTSTVKLESLYEELTQILDSFLNIGVLGFIFENTNELINTKGSREKLEMMKMIYQHVKKNSPNSKIFYSIEYNDRNFYKSKTNLIMDNYIVEKSVDNVSIQKLIKATLFDENIVNVTKINGKRLILNELNYKYLNNQVSSSLIALGLMSMKKYLINMGDEIGLNVFAKRERPFSVKSFMKNLFTKTDDKICFYWDDSMNAGFSKSDNISYTLDKNYAKLSLTSQMKNQLSPLKFWRSLNKIIMCDIFQTSFNDKKPTIKIKKNVVHFSFKEIDFSLNVLVNVSDKQKNIKDIDINNIVLSNYIQNTNAEFDKSYLSSFETIVYCDNKFYTEKFKECLN